MRIPSNYLSYPEILTSLGSVIGGAVQSDARMQRYHWLKPLPFCIAQIAGIGFSLHYHPLLTYPAILSLIL
jgi:hypothetical protein